MRLERNSIPKKAWICEIGWSSKESPRLATRAFFSLCFKSVICDHGDPNCHVPCPGPFCERAVRHGGPPSRRGGEPADLASPSDSVSPNASSAPSPASFSPYHGGLRDDVSNRGRSSGVLDSAGASGAAPVYKKRGRFGNAPIPGHDCASDTSGLPMDATTSRRKRRCPPLHAARHRHMCRV